LVELIDPIIPFKHVLGQTDLKLSH